MRHLKVVGGGATLRLEEHVNARTECVDRRDDESGAENVRKWRTPELNLYGVIAEARERTGERAPAGAQACSEQDTRSQRDHEEAKPGGQGARRECADGDG